MRVHKQQYLTFKSDAPYVMEHLKDYSPFAKYAVTNVQGIRMNLMNMTMETEIVSSYADFISAGIVNVTFEPEYNELPLESQKHTGFELYFVMNGTLHVKLEHTDYQLKEYDAIVMNQNCRSMIRGGENLILVTMTMEKEYLQKHKLLKKLEILSYKSRYDDAYKDAEYAVLRAKDISKSEFRALEKEGDADMLSVECREDVEKLMYQFHTELTKKLAGYEQIVLGLLTRLFYSINNKKLYDREIVCEHVLAGEDIAESIKAYLDENPRKITVEELTKIFHYNRNYLSKVFAENMSQTIKAYNNTVCMMEAKRLLTETDLPVTLVAERVGFMSRSQFYKVFREQFGCNPG